MADEIERDVGPIDILVNSAGAARRYAPADLDAAAWHAAMDAKYFSYMHPIDAVLRRMVARGRGAIVNIIGSGGKVANPVHLPGGAANAALMLATAGLAAAYAPKGIRINGINPGATLTGRVQQGLSVEAKMTGLAEEELLQRMQARIPLGRLGTPEEVARVALFLAPIKRVTSPARSCRWTADRIPSFKPTLFGGSLLAGDALPYLASSPQHLFGPCLVDGPDTGSPVRQAAAGQI